MAKADMDGLPPIKVVGVGGGGCNAINRMVEARIGGVDFVGVNTDAQALGRCDANDRIRIGERITKGLGAGSDPDKGRAAAEESREELKDILQDAEMVFITAGMGGGTGTGAAPVVASLAKELDALTVAVVTKPFGFEGPRRMRIAEDGLKKLASTVDTVITIPNDRLLTLVPRGTSFFEAFKVADDLLRQAVQGITDIIVTPGLINRDFADIKATMAGMGYAMMGTAIANGENAAVEAARQAISCPLLEDTRISGSRGVLINIIGSSHLGLHEVNEACSIIRQAAECDEVQINFGVILNEAMADAVKITVIATGFQPESMRSAAETGPARQMVEPVVFQHVQPRMPEPAPPPPIETLPVMEPEAALPFDPEPEPAMVAAEPEPMLDLEDLDTPAYLRQNGQMVQ